MEIPDGSFTVIVGPNACGKSTLLRALSRMLKPPQGQVLLDGQAIHVAAREGGRPAARPAAAVLDRAGRASPSPTWSPAAATRTRGCCGSGRAEDERIVEEAMAATGVAELADRYVDELSGGQRQRVWIAMALAQQTPLLLLDEPTTFLDIPHQIEVLDLCAELHETQGRTLVAVLHDLNHACRYATHLIAMRDGRGRRRGRAGRRSSPPSWSSEVFGLRCRVIADPETGTPLVVPAARKARARAAGGRRHEPVPRRCVAA